MNCKTKLYNYYYFAGNTISSSNGVSGTGTYSDIEYLTRFLSFYRRSYIFLIPSLDKAFVKDPDIFNDINIHYFKGINCLSSDYPFIKEYLRYAKKAN